MSNLEWKNKKQKGLFGVVEFWNFMAKHDLWSSTPEKNKKTKKSWSNSPLIPNIIIIMSYTYPQYYKLYE